MSLKLDLVVPLSERTFWRVRACSEVVSQTLKSSFNLLFFWGIKSSNASFEV